MHILFWIFQVLLAAHTAMGAVWKFSHSPEQTMPSLKAIPQSVWLVMAGIELLCGIALLLPALNKRLGKAVPIAALYIAAEMLLFTGLHMQAGESNFGPVTYWFVVAGFCGFLSYGRLVLKPF